MITIHDGPAAGKRFFLKRAPLFLRVTQAPDGTWDALDQIEDTPTEHETVHVYRRVGEVGGICHVDGRDLKTGERFSRWAVMADYRYEHPQPPPDDARHNQAWQEWCKQHRR